METGLSETCQEVVAMGIRTRMSVVMDSGETWERLTLPYDQDVLSKIVFLDENNGLALGSGIMIKTNDKQLGAHSG